jgi:hypothetical protein
MAAAEEDKVVVEEEGGAADKDQRVAVDPNYRYSVARQISRFFYGLISTIVPFGTNL